MHWVELEDGHWHPCHVVERQKDATIVNVFGTLHTVRPWRVANSRPLNFRRKAT